MEARYYSPALGRFVSRDPIGYDGGINLYAYCGGDPVNYRDPEGLDFSVGPSDHPWLAFNEDDTLNGLAVGCQAVRYVFTGTLWKPDSRFKASPYYGTSVVLSWVGLGCTATYGAWRFASAFAGPATVAMSSTSAASNPAEEADAIDQFGNNCLDAILNKLNYCNLPQWIINAADGNGNLTIGRAMNAGETFGPEGITPSGWGWVHLTSDMNLIKDLMEAGRPYSASVTISLSDLNSLAQANDMLLFGDNMREIRVPNYLLAEFASKLR